MMKKIILLFLISLFSTTTIAQENFNIPTKFSTDFEALTFPLGSKITIELKGIEKWEISISGFKYGTIRKVFNSVRFLKIETIKNHSY